MYKWYNLSTADWQLSNSWPIAIFRLSIRATTPCGWNYHARSLTGSPPTHGATNFLFRGLVRVRTPPHDSVKVRSIAHTRAATRYQQNIGGLRRHRAPTWPHTARPNWHIIHDNEYTSALYKHFFAGASGLWGDQQPVIFIPRPSISPKLTDMKLKFGTLVGICILQVLYLHIKICPLGGVWRDRQLPHFILGPLHISVTNGGWNMAHL